MAQSLILLSTINYEPQIPLYIWANGLWLIVNGSIVNPAIDHEPWTINLLLAQIPIPEPNFVGYGREMIHLID